MSGPGNKAPASIQVIPREPMAPTSQQPQQRRQFKIGKYDILAQPASGSMHMLRYTVMLNGKRLGALLSVPTESDCRFLEAPPAVPPVKIFQVTHRPGRPKKGTVRPGANGN